MRLFRTEEAARKAGFIFFGQDRRICHSLNTEARILTDRERALLEALERVIPLARELSDRHDDEDAAIEAAEALIRELNVEG